MVEELKFFEMMPSLDLSIHHAALATDHRGKRFSHQYRIPQASLKRAKVLIEGAVRRVQNSKSFHELHSLLEQLLGGVRGLGELYCYDTALRLGAALSLAPEFVYLHRGTRAGARALGLNASAPFVKLQELPAPIRVLPPHEAEDFLCIYKRRFRNVKAKPPHPRRRA
jgi:hypothetical protein